MGKGNSFAKVLLAGAAIAGTAFATYKNKEKLKDFKDAAVDKIKKQFPSDDDIIDIDGFDDENEDDIFEDDEPDSCCASETCNAKTDADGMVETPIDKIAEETDLPVEELDTTDDGQVDTVAIDSDEDGRADKLILDTTGDGRADTAFVDTTDDGIVDTVIDLTKNI